PKAFAPIADLVRHIAGNPFRKIARPTSWPSAVEELAAALYAGGDRAEALHDALRAAQQNKLAEHFQQQMKHPKGCWALDLILGKRRILESRCEFDVSGIGLVTRTRKSKGNAVPIHGDQNTNSASGKVVKPNKRLQRPRR